MFDSKLETLIILPIRESFTPQAAGAIAMVVRRLARAANATVLGKPVQHAYADARFFPVGRDSSSKLGYISAVVLAVRKLRAEVIEVHQFPLLARVLAFLFPRRRVMLVIHNDPLTMHGLKTAAQRRAMLARLHRVVTVSAHLSTRYMSGVTGAVAPPVVMMNPIDLKALPPPAEKRVNEFLFVGRVTRDKGVDLFMEACGRVLPELPGWSARMIGGERFGHGQTETPFFRSVLKLAEKNHVTCTGYLTHDEVLLAMGRAAVVTMPSRMIEGFPLTAIEAMASGAALIATGQGGLREVAGEAALYVPVDDVAALAAAMMKLAQDAQARLALTKAGWQRAGELDTPMIAEKWAELRRVKK